MAVSRIEPFLLSRKINYGNCYIGGLVDVNLNGVRIDYAWSNTPILRMREPSSSIIQYNKLSTFQCGLDCTSE